MGATPYFAQPSYVSLEEKLFFGPESLPYAIENLRENPYFDTKLNPYKRKRGIGVTIDPESMSKFLGGLTQARIKAFGAAVAAVLGSSKIVLGKAEQLCPEDTGELIESGSVVLWDKELIATTGSGAATEGMFKLRPKQQIIAGIYFNSNHAAPVHEKEEKFLQKALSRTKRVFRNMIVSELNKALSGGAS